MHPRRARLVFVLGLSVALAGLSATPGADGDTATVPNADRLYLELSNEFALATNAPAASRLNLAHVFWRSGRGWPLEHAWRTWPNGIRLSLTNGLDFFSGKGLYNETARLALGEIMRRPESGTERQIRQALADIAAKRYLDALETLDKALGERSAGDPVRRTAIWLAVRLGQPTVALRHLRLVLSTDTTPPVESVQLAFGLALACGEYREAVYWGETLARNMPRIGRNLAWLNNMALAVLGTARSETNRQVRGAQFSRAIGLSEDALRLGRTATVFDTAAIIQEAVSNYYKAAQYLQLALALDGNNTNYRTRLQSVMRKLRANR